MTTTRRKARTSATVAYTFDEANRLVVVEGGVDERLRPTQVLEGTVTIDRRNRLIYRVERRAVGVSPPTLRRFLFDGTWSLTANHDLQLMLHEGGRPSDRTLLLQGRLVEASAHALIVALRRRGPEGAVASQRLTLSGRWQADEANRLTFLVEKADGSEDRLTFEGSWSVTRRHELLYAFRRREGRDRPVRTLRFSGVWDITGSHRLVYRVDGSDDSRFEFRASLQSPSLNAGEGRIVYQVGVGVAGGAQKRQRVVLFGTWKLRRDLSVSFEIPYADGRRSAIDFQAAYAVTAKDEIAVQLLDRRRKPLGLSVTFRRKLSEDARLFLRLRKAGEDAEAIAGVQVRF